MIAYLRGTVRSPGVLVTSSGVGYRVISTVDMVPGSEQELDVLTIYGRDGAVQLYGFANPTEAAVFTALTKVQKIGPAAAMSILRNLGVAELYAAVQNKDPKALTRATGVGLKAAETICSLVQLPDNIELTDLPNSTTSAIYQALLGLGFPDTLAREAAAHVDLADDEATQLSQAIVYARMPRTR